MVSRPRRLSSIEVSISSQIDPIGMPPPIASIAERRKTKPVPQQKAAPQASRLGMITSKNMR